MSTTYSRAADRARIAEIEAQILFLKNSLQALEADRLGAQERLDSYTYPVLTLPNEITSEIFTRFIPAYPSPPPLAGPLSPTTLTHVCHNWRAIALATPALWRAISLPLDLDENGRLCILQSWLSRSGCSPFSFEMEIWESICDKEFEALVIHCARWEYVTLAVDETAGHTIQAPMPLLRYLDLRVHSYFGVNGPQTRLREVPRLRSVTLRQSDDLTDDFLPWAQLTSLTLVSRLLDDCTPILRNTVNLVRCHLSLSSGPDPSRPVPEIRLPFLKSLSFTQLTDYSDDNGEPVVTRFLKRLITPALRTLYIPETILQPDPVDGLGAFISNSGCCLQRLCITGRPRRVHREVYLQAFPNILELSFDPSLSDHESYSRILAHEVYIL
ncbi:hypothetical protein C8R45DRAFT_599654 [Mycena sanguinolenta]|nr:hypothetical protein C8R45DRAFT_599654 [Mycena sanguinolenta]